MTRSRSFNKKLEKWSQPMAKTKKLAKSYRVPQSRDECDEMIHRLGEARRRVARIEADMNDQLAKVKEEFETKAEADKLDVENLFAGIEDWCASNRDEITRGGKVKFCNMKNGTVKWRNRPKKVNTRNVSQALEALKSLGLKRFIRTKEEINKDAILDEPEAVEAVKGIAVASAGEDFEVEPFETSLQGEAA